MADMKPSKAPSLPLPPQSYSPQVFDGTYNALRLYFNQVDNNNALLIQAVNSVNTLQWLGDLS